MTKRTMQEWQEYWQKAAELTQAGKMGDATALYDKTFGQAQDELLTKITDQKQLVLNAFYAMFVKKTADELPSPNFDVLIWVDGLWEYAHIGIDGDWYDYQDRYWGSKEVKYWIPLPTFDPEN